MTTIRDTITNEARNRSINLEYVEQAEPIVMALEQREEQIVASLRSYALEAGLSGTEADRVLAAAGLSTGTVGSRSMGGSPPPTTPADGRTQRSQGNMQDTINDLVREVSALKQAAEQAGLHI